MLTRVRLLRHRQTKGADWLTAGFARLQPAGYVIRSALERPEEVARAADFHAIMQCAVAPSMINPKEHFERAKRIRYLLLDVDGILTNGVVFFTEKGEETVGFSIYDGLGFSLLRKANIATGWISGRTSAAVSQRAAELGIETYYGGVTDKIETYNEILIKQGLTDEQVAYMGDDLIDLTILRRVGFAVSVPNAMEAVKREAHWITQRRGGEGAVRELIDLLLLAQGDNIHPCLF